jgi:predicted protein tyrosine phosphatase
MDQDKTRRKVLFVCDANRMRSPTAEKIFSDDPRLEVKSAGIKANATVPISRQLLEWAELIVVMEKKQRNAICEQFQDIYESKRIVCLNIPDKFHFMDPNLIRLLRERVEPCLADGPQ